MCSSTITVPDERLSCVLRGKRYAARACVQADLHALAWDFAGLFSFSHAARAQCSPTRAQPEKRADPVVIIVRPPEIRLTTRAWSLPRSKTTAAFA